MEKSPSLRSRKLYLDRCCHRYRVPARYSTLPDNDVPNFLSVRQFDRAKKLVVNNAWNWISFGNRDSTLRLSIQRKVQLDINSFSSLHIFQFIRFYTELGYVVRQRKYNKCRNKRLFFITVTNYIRVLRLLSYLQ